MIPALAAAVPWIVKGIAGLGAGLSVAELIQDVTAKGADPKKIEAITNARNARAEQLMAATPNMSRLAAENAANDELRPFMEQAEQGGSSGGEIAGDLLNVAAMGGLAAGAGKLGKKALGLVRGKKTAANAPTPGGPATATEKVNGTEPSIPSAAPVALKAWAGAGTKGREMSLMHPDFMGPVSEDSPYADPELMRLAMKVRTGL